MFWPPSSTPLPSDPNSHSFVSPYPVQVDRTAVDLRVKALELALEHWAPSGYRDVFAMADDLCAWLHRQRQEPKGE